MPEGPEAKRMAESLARYILGNSLISITIDEKSKYTNPIKYPNGIPGYSRLNLPLTVVDVYSRGKKLIIHLKKEGSSVDDQLKNDGFLVFTLGMEGKFLKEPTSHSNLHLNFENRIAYFDDVRHFGSVEICIGFAELEVRLSDLGPDLLQDEISAELWRKIFRRCSQNFQICRALMDQDKVSGIGNYLKAEILYRARIRPDRTLRSLSDDELERLRIIGHQTIREAYAYHGNTIASYWDMDGNKGLFQCQVYGKAKDPEGNEVVKNTFTDGRTTHWVPALQK